LIGEDRCDIGSRRHYEQSCPEDKIIKRN